MAKKRSKNEKVINHTYFCAVEGQQEDIYLKHLEKLLTDFPRYIVKFNVTKGKAYLLEKNPVDYDSACLFDFDFNEQDFKKNILTCLRLDKERKANVYHAYSNVCFDLWLILHKKDYNRPVVSNDGYVDEVRKTFGLIADADIKERKNIEKIVNTITINDVMQAIERAEKIRHSKLSCDKKILDSGDYYYPNPDFSIDLFLKDVIKNFESNLR